MRRPQLHLLPAVLVLALALLPGCTTQPAAPQAADTTKYTLENTDKFTLLDKATLSSIACTGLHHRPLADGRIEVVANLKNRESRPVRIEASCVYRDAAGVPNGESPWQSITIPAATTETVRFTAPNVFAKSYTIRVRQGR